MLFSEIINALGITEYPPLLREIYEKGESLSDFSEKTVDMLDEEYLVIGECKNKIIESYENAKKVRRFGSIQRLPRPFFPACQLMTVRN